MLSLGLSIIVAVISAFALVMLLADTGLFYNGPESAIQSLTLGCALVPAVLYVALSIRSLHYKIGSASLGLGKNILVAVVAGFLFTVATSSFYSNIAFYANLSFLTTHILPLWFFVGFVMASAFSLDYVRRGRSSTPPKTPLAKVT